MGLPVRQGLGEQGEKQGARKFDCKIIEFCPKIANFASEQGI
jgi:hypothetical protein